MSHAEFLVSFIYKSIIVLQEEIERLRKEGSKAVEEEMEAVYKEMRKQKNEEHCDCGKYRIKVKWSADKTDVNNGGYSQELLHKFFSKVCTYYSY